MKWQAQETALQSFQEIRVRSWNCRYYQSMSYLPTDFSRTFQILHSLKLNVKKGNNIEEKKTHYGRHYTWL